MTPMLYIKLYLTSLAIFSVIDLVWIGIVAMPFYKAYLGYILSPSPNWLAAVLFYLIFLVGLLVLVIAPSIELNRSLWTTAVLGALFGCVTYAAYDLTNMATLRGWPWIVTLVDMTWGTLLCATISTLTVWISRSF